MVFPEDLIQFISGVLWGVGNIFNNYNFWLITSKSSFWMLIGIAIFIYVIKIFKRLRKV